MSKLVLIRHGESQWNLENRFTGWVDVPLSPKGIEEAKAAGKKLAGFTFDRAFSSVLARANETLRLVLEGIGQTGIPIEKDKALNERMYGELQGLNKAETAKKFGDEQVKIWRRSYDVRPPGGESLKDTAERVLPYYDSQHQALRAEGRDDPHRRPWKQPARAGDAARAADPGAGPGTQHSDGSPAAL
jgi:2,3-bisphosphoglycerate-dependent phosphoglycerate mutase